MVKKWPEKNPFKFLLLTHFPPYMPKTRGFDQKTKKWCHHSEITIARLKRVYDWPLLNLQFWRFETGLRGIFRISHEVCQKVNEVQLR